VALQYAHPEWLPYLSWLSFYFAISAAVVAHNHQHCPIFVKPAHNHGFADWISLFYGYPTFAWVPTHNLNHHRRVNKAGDATITWRFTNRHNLLVAATYFFVSAYYQAEPIQQFIARAKAQRPEQYRKILRQYVVVFGGQAVMLGVSVALHGLGLGVKVWALTMGLPAFTALWTVMLFNYEQHVHTDPWSKLNHSRNFVGKLLNFLLFNNGLHTAHHEKADLHWSELRALHQKIETEIHTDLKQQSLWFYWFKQYVLAPFWPKIGTQQIGRAPFDVPTGERTDRRTDEVSLGEFGFSASRE
jgi:beta-carotene hydroxylase